MVKMLTRRCFHKDRDLGWINMPLLGITFVLLSIGIGLGCLMYTIVENGNGRERELQYTYVADNANFMLRNMLGSHREMTRAIAAANEGNGTLSREEFYLLAQSILQSTQGVQSYVFARKVMNEDLEAYENTSIAYWKSIFPDADDSNFMVKWRTVPGQSIIAPRNHTVYYPADYRYPEFNIPTHGFLNMDVLSLNDRIDELMEAIETGETVMTSRIYLSFTKEYGTMFISPSVRPQDGIGLENAVGVVRAIFVLQDVIVTALRDLRGAKGIEIHVFDSTDEANAEYLHGIEFGANGPSKNFTIVAGNEEEFSRDAVMSKCEESMNFCVHRDFLTGGRKWESIVVVGPRFGNVEHTFSIWLLASSVLVFWLVTIILWGHQRSNFHNLKARQEAQNKAREQIMSYFMHEVRGPIHILSHLGQALKGVMFVPQDADQGGRLVDVLNASIAGLYNLCNSFLDQSKLNTLSLELCQVEEVNLSNVLRDTYHQHSILCSENPKVSWKLDISAEVFNWVVPMDPVRVRQIIANGLTNAYKHTEEGEIIVRMGKVGANQVIISITDTGEGLGDCDPETLFEDFVQANHGKKARVSNIPSTGLGLPIARKLARQMNGDIKLRNCETGRGTIFEFSMRVKEIKESVALDETVAAFVSSVDVPRSSFHQNGPNVGGVREASPASDITVSAAGTLGVGSLKESESRPAESFGAGGTVSPIVQGNVGESKFSSFGGDGCDEDMSSYLQSKVIFGCEDDPVINMLLSQMLKKFVKRVETYLDGLDLIEELEKIQQQGLEMPDVLLIDIVMKRSMGDEVIRKIRNMGISIPCIAVTGNCSQHDMERFLSIGFQEVVTKPYSNAILVQSIYETLKANDNTPKITIV